MNEEFDLDEAYNTFGMYDNDENKGRFSSFALNYNHITNIERGYLYNYSGEGQTKTSYFMKFYLSGGTYVMKLDTIYEHLERFLKKMMNTSHDDAILFYTLGYTDAKINQE